MAGKPLKSRVKASAAALAAFAFSTFGIPLWLTAARDINMLGNMVGYLAANWFSLFVRCFVGFNPFLLAALLVSFARGSSAAGVAAGLASGTVTFVLLSIILAPLSET